MTRSAKLFFLLVLACTNSWLFGQTKIKLLATYMYWRPFGEPENPPYHRVLTNNPWVKTSGLLTPQRQARVINPLLPDNPRNLDGIAKVYSYNNETVANGYYVFGYDSEGYSSHLEVYFATVGKIRKIEFYDKNNNKMFEDVFEELSSFRPEIVRTSENSFTIPRKSSLWLSADGGKTWKLAERVSPGSTDYNIDREIIESPNTVIVVTGSDPNPPNSPGVALWSTNPNFVLDFADDEEPEPQTVTPASSTTAKQPPISTKNPEPKKSILSRILGK